MIFSVVSKRGRLFFGMMLPIIFIMITLSGFFSVVVVVEALSDTIIPRKFIELNNPLGSATDQKLPASFVSTWPTWVLDMDGHMSKIPDSDGFVPPTSIDELWQPIDLKRPDARLALGLHVREGVIRHVMPAVDLTLDGKHRNRGMCSVPRAHSWIDFTNSLDEWANYEILLEEKRKDENEWTELLSIPGSKLTKAIERAMICLAESPPDELGDGSHLINVLLVESDAENADDDDDCALCPKTGSELRVSMDDDDYLGDTPAPGLLQVVVSAAAAGSGSEFLPQAYRSLFDDESLRNPLYERFKQRQDERNKD